LLRRYRPLYWLIRLKYFHYLFKQNMFVVKGSRQFVLLNDEDLVVQKMKYNILHSDTLARYLYKM
jgi:hypothetical protein